MLPNIKCKKCGFPCPALNCNCLYLHCCYIVFLLYLPVSSLPPAANERTLHILPHSVAGESASNTLFSQIAIVIVRYFSSRLFPFSTPLLFSSWLDCHKFHHNFCVNLFPFSKKLVPHTELRHQRSCFDNLT